MQFDGGKQEGQIKQDILPEISRSNERGMERLLCEKEYGVDGTDWGTCLFVDFGIRPTGAEKYRSTR